MGNCKNQCKGTPCFNEKDMKLSDIAPPLSSGVKITKTKNGSHEIHLR